MYKKNNTFSSCFSTCVLLFLILFCAGQMTNAQPYPSIFGTEKTQFNMLSFCAAIKGTDISATTTKFYIENDTIIDEQQYKMIKIDNDYWHYDFSYLSGIREDTVEGKIYVYGEPFGEILTCDFSLSVGDTFYFPQYKYNQYFPFPSLLNEYNGFMIVDDIIVGFTGQKTLTFDGPYYVYNDAIYKYYFGELDNYKVSFIESVGPNYGPFDFTHIQMLLCVHKDDDLAYMQREDIGCEYNDCKGSVNEVLLDRIKIYPNPTRKEIRIESGELKVENVEIFDIYGRKQNVRGNNLYFVESKLDISQLSAGIYFVKIFTEAGEVIKKVLKE